MKTGMIVTFVSCMIVLTLSIYHTDERAMQLCEMSHSHDACFQAMNR